MPIVQFDNRICVCAAFIAAIGLTACDRVREAVSGKGSLVLLEEGSPKACASDDVVERVIEGAKPDLAFAPPYDSPDVDPSLNKRAVTLVKYSLDRISLASFDAPAKIATCEGSLNISYGSSTQTFVIAYQLRPPASATDEIVIIPHYESARLGATVASQTAYLDQKKKNPIASVAPSLDDANAEVTDNGIESLPQPPRETVAPDPAATPTEETALSVNSD